MTSVIAHIKPTSNIPQRLVGNVTKNKSTGFLSIEHKEPGKVKTTSKSFDPTEVSAYQVGEAGFIVALSTAPVVSLVGELTTKGDQTYLKTETGNIVLNKNPNVTIEYAEVDPESREARAAERASKVKVRGAGRAAKTEKADKPAGKSRRAAKEEAAPDKSERRKRREAAATDAGAARKKKRRAAE